MSNLPSPQLNFANGEDSVILITEDLPDILLIITSLFQISVLFQLVSLH